MWHILLSAQCWQPTNQLSGIHVVCNDLFFFFAEQFPLLFLARLRLVFAHEYQQRIRLVLVDRPVKLTSSSRIRRSGLPKPHQHHCRTLRLAQRLVHATCPGRGTATPTPRETAQPPRGTAAPTSRENDQSQSGNSLQSLESQAGRRAMHDPHRVRRNERATPRQVGAVLF